MIPTRHKVHELAPNRCGERNIGNGAQHGAGGIEPDHAGKSLCLIDEPQKIRGPRRIVNASGHSHEHCGSTHRPIDGQKLPLHGAIEGITGNRRVRARLRPLARDQRLPEHQHQQHRTGAGQDWGPTRRRVGPNLVRHGTLQQGRAQ